MHASNPLRHFRRKVALHSVGAIWRWPFPLTGFLEPGAHLTRYLVAPGSRNHGSELPYDGRDLNAYTIYYMCNLFK